MQVYHAVRAATPQNCVPARSPHLLLAVGGEDRRRFKPAGCKVHYASCAPAPQERVVTARTSPRGLHLDAKPHLLSAANPPG
jgi:hypothetical protein